ncbi:hypothetical protein EO087_00175 [Dyella sp. M7H15-1]|uniref:DNA modification methylase n=1 Tax=Dyella sp. M7H15-1 TaxID=2501295 RepID=UPI001004D799|nr:DNA modification methylase [Dyella sp. M7H15-1]QAU22582.1 hypothetical protein EO087_00175 [Dyella sp. M7H15-1]
MTDLSITWRPLEVLIPYVRNARTHSDAQVAQLAASTAGLTDDDAAPAVAEAGVSQSGDIWICGDHRVMCGNSANVTDVEQLMDGYKADLIITDPPYNVAYQGKPPMR